MLPTELNEERKRRGGIFHGLRKSRKISLNELSRITGLARETIRKIEDGASSWNIDTEIILSRALSINQFDGSVEICHDGGKITSLKITGVNLNSRVVS